MARKRFEVKEYRVFLGTKLGVGRCAQIDCIGSDETSELLYLMFWPKNIPVPQNRSIINQSRVVGHMNLPSKQYPWYVDLLRNEAPIWAMIDDTDPESNTISTTSEPVGEEE